MREQSRTRHAPFGAYLLLLHCIFVRFLHLVHLHSHIGLLVLEVCFELCELERRIIVTTLNKKRQQGTGHNYVIRTRGPTFRSFSRMVWSLCCRSRFSDITSSFSWLMRMKLSVPPESIDWVMELLMGERKELEDGQFRHFILIHEITTLIVPVPIWWLHLQFWFLLWSLLLDWRRFMAARTIKWHKNSVNMNWWCLLINWKFGGCKEKCFLTSASTVPAPAQDSSSHSACQGQVSSKLTRTINMIAQSRHIPLECVLKKSDKRSANGGYI